MDDKRNVVMDTCCLISLGATGELPWILSNSGLTWHVPVSVEAQGVSIRASSDPTDDLRVPIEVDVLRRDQFLRRCDLRAEDLELFLELAAAHGDDTDATALTIAIVNQFWLATDDKALARLATTRGVMTLSTAAILRQACSTIGTHHERIRQMLVRVEKLGRWTPQKTDPDAVWWQRAVGGE